MQMFLQSEICHVFASFCAMVEDGFSPDKSGVDNAARVPDKLAHFPAGVGYKCLVHYGQMFRDKKFQRYDFGEQENQVRYGQSTPPEYDLR